MASCGICSVEIGVVPVCTNRPRYVSQLYFNSFKHHKILYGYPQNSVHIAKVMETSFRPQKVHAAWVQLAYFINSQKNNILLPVDALLLKSDKTH